MQTIYQDMARKGEINIEKCLQIISDEVSKKSKCGFIAFGNTLLFNDKNGVTQIAVNSNKAVALYSENGYETLEDIARWADICQDFNASVAAGNDKYFTAWNVKGELLPGNLWLRYLIYIDEIKKKGK